VEALPDFKLKSPGAKMAPRTVDVCHGAMPDNSPLYRTDSQSRNINVLLSQHIRPWLDFKCSVVGAVNQALDPLNVLSYFGRLQFPRGRVELRSDAYVKESGTRYSTYSSQLIPSIQCRSSVGLACLPIRLCHFRVSVEYLVVQVVFA
jgi:hypothetical protein